MLSQTDHSEHAELQKINVVPLKQTDSHFTWLKLTEFLGRYLIKSPLLFSKKYVRAVIEYEAAKARAESAKAAEITRSGIVKAEKIIAESEQVRATAQQIKSSAKKTEAEAESIGEDVRTKKLKNDLFEKAILMLDSKDERSRLAAERLLMAKGKIESLNGAIFFDAKSDERNE